MLQNITGSQFQNNNANINGMNPQIYVIPNKINDDCHTVQNPHVVDWMMYPNSTSQLSNVGEISHVNAVKIFKLSYRFSNEKSA